MTKKAAKYPDVKERPEVLTANRNLKMARSAHAYVRGNTLKFYQWLENTKDISIPHGPAIWICGDCHLGNLGPVANKKGEIEIQIRDVDQTVIGNPAHDLIRLGLSLASLARSSDLPGVTTAKILEQTVIGYQLAFNSGKNAEDVIKKPDSVKIAMKDAWRRSWKHLAQERIEDTKPTIPLGKKFWPLTKEEYKEVTRIFETKEMRKLITSLRSRDDDAAVEIMDAAYWMKGCSSLGRLRIAVLLSVGKGKDRELCLMDIKEAVTASAPRYPKAKMPRDNGERVVEGANHLAPHLGKRMFATRFLDHSVFIRELLPQDIKLDIAQITHEEAIKAAGYLAFVVGKAHAQQMSAATKEKWLQELKSNHSKTLDAPSWLWASVVELLVSHEAAYLEHCRKYAMSHVQD
jgi:uncharacterized protein (DUF2252 family)